MKRWRNAAFAFAALAILLLMLAQIRQRPFVWNLPDNVPRPVVPADNPMNRYKVELGRWLFYDVRLSVNESFSCASCHLQALAFTDGRKQAIGATGELHPRGSMSLVNAAYASRLTWANNLLSRLEDQALTPMFGETPVEMGMSGLENRIISVLRSDARYQKLLPRAFPGDADPYSVLNTVRCIASFVRTIVSFDAPYDRYLRGDPAAMTESQLRGMDLFFSERLECFHCHGGFNFTDSSSHENTLVESVGFHNNGLYNIENTGAYPQENTGLYELTGNRRDMGRFKAPTLRNIGLTAPYMHDGSLESLDDVIEHYRNGGRTVATGPHAGDGSRNPYKSVFVREFELSDSEKDDLLAFLQSLTDESVIENPDFTDPFAGDRH